MGCMISVCVPSQSEMHIGNSTEHKKKTRFLEHLVLTSSCICVFFCEYVNLGLIRETDEIWKSRLIVLRGVCATHWNSYFLTFHLVESGSRLPSIHSTNTQQKIQYPKSGNHFNERK